MASKMRFRKEDKAKEKLSLEMLVLLWLLGSILVLKIFEMV